MPLCRRIAHWLAGYRFIAARSRIVASATLPELFDRLGRCYGPEARMRGIRLEFELDPALAVNVPGPFAALAQALSLLLERSLDAATTCVAFQVDVVGDDTNAQVVHFTVADQHMAEAPECVRLREARVILAALGGIVHREQGADIGRRVIVELALEKPRVPPRIDVDALRSTLGGEDALRQVIAALDRALISDLAGLDTLLDQTGAGQLQTWLHRVSGALGMAEATELSSIGLALERELLHGRSPHADRAIRRFADDAAQVLATLREHAGPIGYSSGS